MRKINIIKAIASCALLFTMVSASSAANVSDAADTSNDSFYVNDNTTLAEVFMYAYPEEYAQYPESVKKEFSTTKFADVQEIPDQPQEPRSDVYAAALSGDLKAPGLGTIIMKGKMATNKNGWSAKVPYISLNGVLTDPNGKVLKSVGDRDTDTSSVSFNETLSVTPVKGTYTLTLAGYVEFPSFTSPPTSALTGKKTVTPSYPWGE